MKNFFKSLLAISFFIALFFVTPVFLQAAPNSPPIVGGALPDFNLSIPKDPISKDYLGLTGEGSFKISQIKAPVVVIEIFSLYCPYCQREAKLVNQLYQAIENSPELKGKIKLMGIGAGNSSFEADVFKKRYEVPFPLFSDVNFIVHKCFGEVRTPYFTAIKINDDGTHKVLYSELGSIKEVEKFLKLIVELSGLKSGVGK